MDTKNLETLFEDLKGILHDIQAEKPGPGSMDSSCQKLGQGLEALQRLTEEMLRYSFELSQGNLSVPCPSQDNPLCPHLKKLHASLRHLTWQADQVASGDYAQRVTCLGEFSKAFNTMTAQLEERERQLLKEKNEIEKQADMLNGYNELLLELTRKQKEWILVVDAENRNIVYCNKRGPGKTDLDDKEFCRICDSRLPFRTTILNWEDNGQDHTWEFCDGNHQYYKITTFPLKWQKRRSYAHILLDITDERLQTRTLKDKAYHDVLTGVYNRIYFEEYMENNLRDKVNVVLGYLDLDCLKSVNDQYGHAEGDSYIRRFVSTVQRYFRTTDIFCRVGGDEFCLVLKDIPKDRAAEKLEAAMKQFQSYDDKEYIHGFSFGVVDVNGAAEPKTLKEIIQEADEAMYQCKRLNKELYKKKQEEGRT